MNRNVKASTWYLVGNLFDKAIAFLTIPIFTRMLSTTDYGIVSTYISWVTILAIILGLSMETSIQTAYFEHDDMNSYASSIVLSGFGFTLIFSVIVMVISRIFFSEVSVLLITLALLQGFMMFVLNVAKMYYMMQVKYIQRVALMSVPHTLVAFFSVWGITLCSTDKYMGRIVPYAFVIAAFGIAMMVYFFIKTKKKFSISHVKYALSYSLPIIFHALSLQILAQSDKIMLTSMRSAAETGVYSLIYNVGLVSQVFTNALDNAWLPWFQKKMREDDHSHTINRNASRLMIIVSLIVTGIVIAAPEIVKVLATEEYWGGIPMVIPIVLATYVMFMYTLEVHIEYCCKQTKKIPLNTIIAAGSNLVLNYIFIPKYGAQAAAYTTLVAYTVSFILHYVAAHKCDKDVLTLKIFVMPLMIVLVGSAFMFVFINQWIIRWVVNIGVLFAFFIYFKKNDILHSMMID